MRKIISLFCRDYKTTRLAINEVVSGAEWVLNGEGVATRKFDGSCCMVENKKLFKRYDVKKGKTPPYGFIPAQEPDPVTGHWPGWVEVGNGPEDKWHREAVMDVSNVEMPDGTYELVGPKIQGNPEKYAQPTLIPHGQVVLHNVPRTFKGLLEWFKDRDIEGIVWHHKDGRMVKIKKKDFGFARE